MIDLWPDEIKLITLRTPETVLSEQAKLLLKKTNDLVTAGVEREIPFEDETDSLKYNFYIIAPYVENYRYPLFAIEYEMDLYPVRFQLRDDLQEELKGKLGEWEGELMAKSEEEFYSILTEIFQSEKAKLVIGSLMALSEEPKTSSEE